MKIRFLLLGTSLSLIPQLTFAQCVATQDCETLGYTETSCNGSRGVKCPFGNKWACLTSEDEISKEICSEMGFKYECLGSNYTGGNGQACGEKYYKSCVCASGYEWQETDCIKKPDFAGCSIGALFYADNTCSNEKLNNKELLGIVIFEKSANANGWIIAEKPLALNLSWSTEAVDIPDLNNYEAVVNDIQNSCMNTDIITAFGNSSMYPAAWEAKNYRPTGTPADKSWCLPSGGLFGTINNKESLTKINQGIISAGGTILGLATGGSEIIWSSSEMGKDGAWRFNINKDGSCDMTVNPGNAKIYKRSVRPVMSF